MSDTTSCAFCDIINGVIPASIVAENQRTIAFMDLRQYHPGHVLIVPKLHVPDLRKADDATATAVMLMTSKIARAVSTVFKCEGLSIWHSAGEAANQEVPHLHFHVHPRRMGDDVLRVYPKSPATPPRTELSEWAAQIEAELGNG